MPGISFKDSPSRTKQSFKEEANINNIMHQYIQTGVMPSGRHQLQFGDFTSPDQYADLLNRVLEARQDFDTLPSDIRDRFANSPEQLIKFMSNPDNEAEAIKLGLIPDPNPDPAPVEPSAPVPEE